MKTINKIFTQKLIRKRLSESTNIEFATIILYTLYEQYPNFSDVQILSEFDKQMKFNSLCEQNYNQVKDNISKLYEESLAPTNVSTGIESSIPRISATNKENKNVIRRNKEDKTKIQ